MKRPHVVWILAATALALAACSSAETATGGEVTTPVADESSVAALSTSYEGALPVQQQLMLGTLELDETEQAVTPDQAQKLLPLWQALQGGVTLEAEIEAVIAQIEATMNGEQIDAIAAMELTLEDQRAWAEEQGLSFAPPGGPLGEDLSDEERAARREQFDDMSEEERANMRATAEAGGGMFFGPGPFDEPPGEMSDERRADIRATMEAAGGPLRPGGAGRGLGMLLEPLIAMLTERAAG